jgi:type II secretory pathway component PulF
MPSFLTAYRTLDDSRPRAEFYRMWGAGQSAGLTLPLVFETMGPREAPAVEASRRWLLDGVRKGRGIADLVRAGATRFELFEQSLLILGEESGSLDESVRLLAEFYSKKHRLMLWVKKQMAYPFFTMFFACFIAPLQLLFFGHAQAYVGIVLASLATLFAAGGSLVVSVANHFGNKPQLVRARFARSLTTAIEAGLPLARAVRLAGDAAANPAMRAFFRARSEISLGTQSLSATLANCPMMTPDLLAAIKIAEQTGDFSVLSRMADLWDDGFR